MSNVIDWQSLRQIKRLEGLRLDRRPDFCSVVRAYVPIDPHQSAVIATGSSCAFPVERPPSRGRDVLRLAGICWNRGGRRLVVAAILAGMAMCLLGLQARSDERPVYVAQINGAIGVGTGYHVSGVLDVARKQNAQLVIFKIDTPGGLVSATREIIQTILASPIPIALFIAPSGARAASAGTYIAYAAHIVAMAPGTHLGAATPIQMELPGLTPGRRPGQPAPGSGKPQSDGHSDAAKNKMVNDAIASLRSLAQLRGRSEEWAIKFVRDAATLTSAEALKEGVTDFVAANERALLGKLHGRKIKTASGTHVLNVRDANIRNISLNWKARFLAAITDPNVAFILLLIGFYGIIFEFWSPGLTGPGVVGGISLIVALAALSALPLSYAGLALLVLGIALMAAEAFAPGFGILGIGGVVAFIAGAIFLFDPSGADIDVSVSWPVIVSAAITSALFLVGLLGFVVRSRRSPVSTGQEELLGLEGEVVSWSGERGRIHIHGETWSARSAAGIETGAKVRVVGRDGLTLIVEPYT